jgi:hypothetical protein
LISLWLEAKNSKRNEAKKIFFRVSVRNACETDLVSLRFALKRKNIFEAKPAHPNGEPYLCPATNVELYHVEKKERAWAILEG